MARTSRPQAGIIGAAARSAAVRAPVADPARKPFRGSIFAGLTEQIISENDTEEEKLNKTLLVFACGLMTFAAMIWLLIYWAMGIKFSVAVPLSYQVISAVSLVHYLKTRNFAFFRFSQVSLFLFVPFVMQWSIGSYVASSGVMLWALLAPVGVMVFQGPRESIPWFFAYLVLTGVSGFFDYYLSSGAESGVPLRTIAVFFALNFAAMSSIVYLIMSMFVREKSRLKSELDEKHHLLKEERDKSERLLLNILPAPIADRLKDDQSTIADGYADATVMFADIVNFTRLSDELPPSEVVTLLNEVFSSFDALAEKYHVEKIKTIGDAYMVAGGVIGNDAGYSAAVLGMALDAREVVRRHPLLGSERSGIHIGIASGPVVAGVIGRKKFIYDLWGDTVNVASRLSSEAGAGDINVDEATARRLKHQFRFEGPELLPIKGKGTLPVYRLVARLAGESVAQTGYPANVTPLARRPA
ncbi:MAG TPA: adenylate/guanylate cyclase domain-containing protein [Burkholderiales bacterium]|nr:adenylate/guanylate cyclase domain-containing protein [Betaproteobacteria bacterium]HQR51690.1 adenylate/guanylate cyclase domain-containing protein [Burkholderiales bacterium]